MSTFDLSARQQAEVQRMAHTVATVFAYDPDAYNLGVVDNFAGRDKRSPHPPNDYKTVAYICGWNDAEDKRRRSPPSFGAGASAQANGTYRSNNPHVRGAPDRQAWRAGWDYLERIEARAS